LQGRFIFIFKKFFSELVKFDHADLRFICLNYLRLLLDHLLLYLFILVFKLILR
jgi:hypothetical protein